MSRVYAALFATAIAAVALPTAASAGCYNCYAPPQPCATCYQQQVVPPQYRAVQETVMVAPGRVIAHRTPAQYQTVMVPRTVMVAPEGVQYEQVPAKYATRERVEQRQTEAEHVVHGAEEAGVTRSAVSRQRPGVLVVHDTAQQAATRAHELDLAIHIHVLETRMQAVSAQ